MQGGYGISPRNAMRSRLQFSFGMTQMPREKVQSVFNRLSPDKKGSRSGKILERYLSVYQIEDGAALSEFDIEGTDGALL